MTCRECIERLSPYHDGALDAGEATAVSGHLASCAACGREWEAYGRAMRALADAPEEPPGLASRVDGAWRSAPSEDSWHGGVKLLVAYVLAAIVTMLVVRSC